MRSIAESGIWIRESVIRYHRRVAQMKIIRGRDVGRTVAVDREIFLGRDEENDLRLLDETSSRRHAKVQRLEDRCVLYDLDSNNGTFVNGERVKERLLRDGDQILIGKTTLIFEEDGVRRAITVTLAEEETPVRVEGSLSADAPVEPSADYGRLRKLYDIATLLGTSLDVRTLADGIVGILLDALDADVVIIVSSDDEPVARTRSGTGGDLCLSSAVLDRARKERRALLVACAPEDRDLARRDSVVSAQIQSMLVAPLMRGERWLGAVYADVRRPARKFAQEDLAFITAAAHQAALAFENAQKYVATQARVVELRAQLAEGTRLVGAAPKFQDAVTLAERAALTDATVLALGESGSGKELFARLVHDRSRRHAGPFVPINCAAITETLLESELFGYEKGAFTGAVKTQQGKFETAAGGTLFLDEIGELSQALQAKLLRFLQDRTYFRVGGAKPRSVDVRIVAATNRDLAKAMKGGQFREDLYYRLSVVTIAIPALRERREDVPVLARHLLDKIRVRLKKPVREFASDAMDALVKYAWPGNVRELENVIERASILSDGPKIELAMLPVEVRTPSAAPVGEMPIDLEEMEKICVRRALEKTGGKKGEAAQLLGISWPTLNKKLKDYGIEI